MPAILVGKDSVTSACEKSMAYVTLKGVQMGERSRRMSAFHNGVLLLIMWLMVSCTMRDVDVR